MIKPKSKFVAALLIGLLLTTAYLSRAQTSGCTPFDFDVAPEFQTGPNAYSMVNADLNGDGNVDVVTPNGEARTVSVLYGDGVGGFTPPQSFSTEIIAGAAAAGDFNRDGKTDLVVAQFNDNKFAVLLNNGQGGFLTPAVSSFAPIARGTYRLRAGDFNGDGNLDVVALTGTNVNFFLGNGQGVIALSASLTWEGTPNEIIVGNFNNDNLSDLIVTNAQFGTPFEFAVIQGNASGTFAINRRFSLQNQPTGIVTGEFNGDGITDIAISANYPYQNSTPQTFFLQPWLGDGNGGFAAGTKIQFPFNVEGVAAGDFNGDGKQDLAANLGSIIGVVNGIGNGTFQNARYWMSTSGVALVSADVNRDGKSDLLSIRAAFPSSSVGVFLSSNDGFLTPKAVIDGGTHLAAADLNGDGLNDFISGGDLFYNPISKITVALSSSAGNLLPDLNFPAADELSDLKIGDFNGDGKKDLISAHNTPRIVSVFLGNGTSSLPAPVNTSLADDAVKLTVGDFNSDGKDDVAVIVESNRVYLLISNGNGTFTTVPNFPEVFARQVEKGDFNEDGKLDLIASSYPNLLLLLGSGNGQFAPPIVYPRNYGDIVVGDFNGDHHLDVAGTGYITVQGNSLAAALIRNFGTGTGTFNIGEPQRLDSPQFSPPFISADFNSDGLDDIGFIVTGGRGNLMITPSTAASPFWTTPIFLAIGGIPSGGFSSSIIAADFNADGKPDIGFTNSYRSRGVAYNVGGQKPCLSINDAVVVEGDGGGATNAVFTVRLSAPSAQTVRVNYSIQTQTATFGADLPNLSGRLEIPAGQTSASITVPIAGDTLDEFDETFLVNLTSAANASIADDAGTGTITDNDAAPTLTIADVSKTEGFSSQQYAFRINLSAPSGKPISFRYTTSDGTAVAGRDYAPSSFTQNLAAGLTTADAYVTVFGDNIFERDETFLLNISEATNLTLADAQAQGTIINDDAAPTISLLSSVAAEGDTDLIERSVIVQLSNPSYLPVTVNFATSDGTALAGRDYVANNGSLTVEPEQSSVTFNVQIIGDTINEPNKFFNIGISNPVNGTISNSQTQFSIIDDESISNDYDRDGKTDFAVFRPSNGTWYTLFSSNGTFSGIQYGAAEDVPVSGDYNNDGRTDIAVWRPSSGSWFVRGINRSQNWGIAPDKPVAGDYDNDGLIDIAVFRPSNGVWYINQSSTNSLRAVQFGIAADVPVPADYDGDGKTDIAVYRTTTGIWYILRSRDGNLATAQFGIATDKPVAADYDGDGRADIAVFREGIWHVLRSSDNRPSSFQWGQADDKPVPGNYDGDDKADFAVYRNGVWYVFQSSNGSVLTKQFGASDDVPIPFVSNN